ncbi:MAG: hypothetical protein HFI02_15985 [Lachnospiraceae bacterium]|nr:hypothetical protein [Lachnospiraceae bacterium]
MKRRRHLYLFHRVRDCGAEGGEVRGYAIGINRSILWSWPSGQLFLSAQLRAEEASCYAAHRELFF